ncbi:MAG: type I-F CRISPR-associated protein Csy1 [Candidatus Schmidhempelia sp.]|nr:type I-F CRISPR-associated protein Csy1 [Candidatus Schmidhempelia sp.]
MNNDITSISAKEIRKTILEFLQQRYVNNKDYKLLTTKLEKAQQENDLTTINETKQKLSEVEQRFEFENWMEDALGRRVLWLKIATHLSKGIHPSSKGCNVNYNASQPKLASSYVSSACVNNLPNDATGNAAALDIFSLLNQLVNEKIDLLQLIINDHPALKLAFSDDQDKATNYLNNIKSIIYDSWCAPQASELNKQFYWPTSNNAYLAKQENNYKVLIPLHPSSLCQLMYQKIQDRFSETNKQAMTRRSKKGEEQQAYFTFRDLAIAQIGGSNPQGVGQLASSQHGNHFLLPSLPPKFNTSRPIRLSKAQKTIFYRGLFHRCRAGFDELFYVVDSTWHNKAIRDKRKQEAFQIIIAEILQAAKQLQTSFKPGWSKDYPRLNIYQQYWLDPQRSQLKDEGQFALKYEQGDWIKEIEKQFALWMYAILQKKYHNMAEDFNDAEIEECQREFENAIRASQRKQEGIF